MKSLASLARAAVVVAAMAGSALAHSKMSTSVPEDGATVPAGLSQIEMRFLHPMRLTLIRVHRDDADVALLAPLPKTFTDAAKVSVDALPAGTYDVSWTAVSEDGHVMKGHFAFTVTEKPGAAPAQ